MRVACIFLLFLLLPTPSRALPVATLEVFDDPQFSQRWGTMDGPMKTLYVRLRYEPVDDGYVDVEFSLTGLDDIDMVIPAYTNEPSAFIGTIAAPADPETGTGGTVVAWPTCQTNELVMTLTLLSNDPPANRTIQVAPRYPLDNPQWAFPSYRNCDSACICLAEIGGQPYTLNPEVSTASPAWGAVKALYR